MCFITLSHTHTLGAVCLFLSLAVLLIGLKELFDIFEGYDFCREVDEKTDAALTSVC